MSLKRIILTFLITGIYSVIWMILELVLYGAVQNREVDNIIMFLFIPIIYLAVR